MPKNLEDIVITSASRTAIGAYKKSLKNFKADKLGSICIKEVINKSKLEVDEIDEIIMGQVLTAGEGQNPSRQAAINSGIPDSKPAHVVNQVCGSGLRSIISGYQLLKLNDAKIVISGGQENMSRAPHSLFYRNEKKINESELVDTMLNDGLIDAFYKYHMGITAENVSEKYNISRSDQDNFALDSQNKANKAIQQNKFKDEIVKIYIEENNKKLIFEKDEHPRENLKIEDLKNLKTVFKKDGTVTAGNSSGLNDGAAALVLMKRENADTKELKPLAKIVSWANCGVDPAFMGLGPIPATKLALSKCGWDINQVDLFEINEAFAAQSIAVIKDLKIPIEKVNVNGGAIALGHPIGASGSRIVVTLIHEMIKQNKKKGVATLCVGGGMGIAICIEKD